MLFLDWGVKISLLYIILVGSLVQSRIFHGSSSIIAANPQNNGANSISIESLEQKLLTQQLPIFEFGSHMEKLYMIAVKEESSPSMESMGLGSEDFFEAAAGGLTTPVQRLELLFIRYVDDLRDHYTKVFSKQIFDTISSSGPMDDHKLASERERILAEARAAMSSSKPALCHSWSFEGPLAELAEDTLAIIDELKAKRMSTLSEDNASTIDDDTSSHTMAIDDDDDDVEGGVSYRTPIKKLRLKLRKVVKTTRRNWKKILKKTFKWVLAQASILAFNFCQNEIHRRSAIRSSERRQAEVPGFPLL